jgi:type I restriction enzyme S subunit
MTLETFFNKFDQFADAPNAVAKMRELVLELAVRGRLIPQARKPDTHPAWLKFCAELDDPAESDGAIPPPPFDAPGHWRWAFLDEVADCRASAKVSPTSIGDSDWVLDLEDIDGTTGQIVQFATFAERRSLSTKAAFEPGDVLYGKLRPYLNKVVVAAKAGFCTTEIIPLRPAAFLSPEFLRFYLRSQTFLRYAAQKNYGMKMPRLGTKDLEAAEIPVPPPAEQKRIVAKVDELMALCNRLEAQQQEREARHTALARASLARFADAPTPANLNFLFHKSYTIPPANLRKSILELAVYGKLAAPTPDDGEVPSLEEFRGAAANLANALGLRSPREPIEDAEPPFEVPFHWRWIELADIGAAQTGTTPSKSDHEAFNGEIPFIKPADISPEGINYSNESLTRYGAESGSRLAPAGSLLMVCIGTIGKCNLIQRECAFNQQINSLTPVKWIESRYLLLATRSPYFQEMAWHKSSRTTIAILNKGRWLSIPVPIPPLAEQRRIVAKVDQLIALVDQLDTQLTASRATAANLLSALVAELTTCGNAGASTPS